MTASIHPEAPHHLPAFITAPGETDVLMVVMAIFLVLAVMMVGILFLRLHTLPERIAHKSHKLQFEIVAVLGLLALFTHMHIFWVAGLLLAMIDLPDIGRPLRRMAGSLEKMAGVAPGGGDNVGEDDVEPGSRGLNTDAHAESSTERGRTVVHITPGESVGGVSEKPVPALGSKRT
jgi:hypothetical protein